MFSPRNLLIFFVLCSAQGATGDEGIPVHSSRAKDVSLRPAMMVIYVPKR